MTTAPLWLVARVIETRNPTPHGRVLRLRVDGWPGNLAGQHVDVRLTAEDGYQAVRSYSLASSGDTDIIELAVDEVPEGEVSPYLVEDVRAGDELEVRGPIGAYFVWTPTQAEPAQLIAGGSGIVPLVAMARQHARARSSAQMRLLYAVRSADDAFYADELDGLSDDAFLVDWAYSRSAPVGSARPAGRVDAATIAASTIPATESPSVYVCGPTGFVEAVADLLVAAGHPPERIRTERFGGA
ncbi:ferredoxin reductase [Microbacterium sp. APC 3901]|uniref:ferredoxin reductase n=1 Tax=Microbacterium sp. APC 3901 TaxID=3035192 RepID=UPI0025B31E66|nr:ferredoxin reductase [Microbacterium sp. APC 3901]MDN3445397.1 ferredoxin reductase [Microbacterium sp. APC 3901]